MSTQMCVCVCVCVCGRGGEGVKDLSVHESVCIPL